MKLCANWTMQQTPRGSSSGPRSSWTPLWTNAPGREDDLDDALCDGVEIWLRKAIRLGNAAGLHRKWKVFKPFRGVCWDTSPSLFVQIIVESQMFTVQQIQAHWPNSSMQMKAALIAGIGHQPVTRLQNAHVQMREWTTPAYQGVQNWLRKGVNNRGMPLALKMLYFFENAQWRAPSRPLPDVEYLYRGIHGDMAEAFERTGQHVERGFLAFSYRKRVARHFSQGQVLMRLKIDDAHIPAGTPWVWFGKEGQPRSYLPSEREVLLLPGTLKVSSDDGDSRAVPVSYTPSDVTRMWPLPDTIR